MCICKQIHGARAYKQIRLWQGVGSLPRCVLPRGYAGHACAGIISSRGPALARRNAGWMDLFQNKLGKNVRRGDSTLDTRPASQHIHPTSAGVTTLVRDPHQPSPSPSKCGN